METGNVITDASVPATEVKISQAFREGPFMIIVTDSVNPDERDHPFVVSPEGGFKTVEEAQLFAEQFRDAKSTTGNQRLSLDFLIVPFRDPAFFKQFMSW